MTPITRMGSRRWVSPGLVVSLTLIMCLVGSALPVTAQEQAETAGPLTRAMTHEAIRLAAVQSGGTPAESNWSRVRKLASGAEIIVMVKGSPPVTRYFVATDDSNLSVLNVGDPALPTAARDVLRQVAATHPEYFPAAQKGGQFVLEKNVRLGPDGVFVADRKVADLEQVVENIARADVGEIKSPPTRRPQRCNACPRAGLGAVLGFVVGFVAGAKIAPAPPDSVPVFSKGSLLGGLVGWVIGGIYDGHRWASSHEPDGSAIYYRAP